MHRLAAVLIVIAALLAAIVALAVMTAGPAFAEARPVRTKAQGRMQACTQIWLDRKAAGNAGAYKPFIRQCLADPAMLAARPRPLMTRSPPRKTEKVSKTQVAGAKKPSRMSLCAAKWREMKAANATNGQSYRQFSSQCLRKS